MLTKPIHERYIHVCKESTDSKNIDAKTLQNCYFCSGSKFQNHKKRNNALELGKKEKFRQILLTLFLVCIKHR